MITPTDGQVEAALTERHMCETCQGNGELVAYWPRYLKGESSEPDVIYECPDCDGIGWHETAVLS